MKKILILFSILALLLCFFSSCKFKNLDPDDIAKTLEDNQYGVYFEWDKDEIKNTADEMDIRSKGIYCILYAEPDKYWDERSGYFIFCESNDIAKKIEKDLKENDDIKDWVTRCIVERSKKTVFIGCEDVWEDIK